MQLWHIQVWTAGSGERQQKWISRAAFVLIIHLIKVWSNSVCTGISPHTGSDNHFFCEHLQFPCPSCLNSLYEKWEEPYSFWFRSIKQFAYHSVAVVYFKVLVNQDKGSDLEVQVSDPWDGVLAKNCRTWLHLRKYLIIQSHSKVLFC